MAVPLDASVTDSPLLGALLCPYSFSPYLLLFFTVLWFVVHRLLAPVLPLLFLPAESRAVHLEKWRRWKQVQSLLRRPARVCGTKNAGETQQLLASTKPQQQEMSERCGEQPEKSLLFQQRHPGREDEVQDRSQALQPQKWEDEGELEEGQQVERGREQQHHRVRPEKLRPSEPFRENSSGAATSDQAWTILSRDDATGVPVDEEEEWEGNEGLRRRIAPGSGDAAAKSRTAADANEDGDAPRERSPAERSVEAKAAAERTAEEEAAAGKESAAEGKEGLAAAAGHIVAAAAEEGAAAVARDSAETATAAAGEESDAGEMGSDPAESEEQELQLLQKYFVVSNANVVGMLHALYLAPTALYYSIKNVVLPAAEVMLAERAAAAAKPDDSATSPAGASGGEQLLTYHHLRELLHIYFLHWDKAPSFWDGSTDCIVILSAYVMTSYFVWDTIECFQNLKVHGRAFFFHALLSLLAGLLQVCARGIRLAGICSMFAVSEISTPFLHFRWFLIHNGQGSSRLCTVTTLWTVSLFILVRAVMVPCLVFSHYWGDLALFHKYTLRDEARISVLRALFMLVLTVAWTALNLFWCFLFFRSVFKRRGRGNRPGGGRKRAIPGCLASSKRNSVRPVSVHLHHRNS